MTASPVVAEQGLTTALARPTVVTVGLVQVAALRLTTVLCRLLLADVAVCLEAAVVPLTRQTLALVVAEVTVLEAVVQRAASAVPVETAMLSLCGD